MFGRLLKPILPRSLFGRALAILVVPIVLIQIVVGIVFVERLFRDVTVQMSRNAAIDIAYVLDAPAAERAARAKALGIEIRAAPRDGPAPQERWRDWFDISGAYIISTLHEELPGVVAVDLGSDRSRAIVTVERAGELLELALFRNRVAPANPHQLLVVMVLASILLAVIAALFMRNQVKPIRRLARAAEAFGKGQALPLTLRGASEVRAATAAFLSMRARIERHIDQRTAMLSGVSHDLRTPLTRLRLSLSLMEESEEVALMQRDLDDMEAILEEFLAFARGDAGEETEKVPIREFAREIVGDAARSGHEVELVFQGKDVEEPEVPMRRLAVRRALLNLLANARKHGTRTRLTVYLGAGFIDFEVEDDGPGIAEEDREAALRPFTRLDAARNRDDGTGVGLGLAIAADVARSHGGELSLGRSEALGGLKARLRLPR